MATISTPTRIDSFTAASQLSAACRCATSLSFRPRYAAVPPEPYACESHFDILNLVKILMPS
jgi:hypothetical protein